jgi:hypothetical protein
MAKRLSPIFATVGFAFCLGHLADFCHALWPQRRLLRSTVMIGEAGQPMQ